VPLKIYRRLLPHIHLPGATYFPTLRLAPTQVEPLTPEERELVVNHIASMKPGTVRTFVVMPDHVHVLYESSQDEDLAASLQALKVASAHRLAKHTGRSAPVSQERTYNHVVRGEQELLETWRYVEANPVRRNLAEVAEAYRWSSAWQRQ
jgi:REP element-mobilizing transposase RayT